MVYTSIKKQSNKIGVISQHCALSNTVVAPSLGLVSKVYCIGEVKLYKLSMKF